MANLIENTCQFTQRKWSSIIIQLDLLGDHLMNLNPVVILFLAVFCSSATPLGNIWLFSG